MKRPLEDNIDQNDNIKTKAPRMGICPSQKPVEDMSTEEKMEVAATGEGYSFPTNLDNDPPKGGLAPETQQAFFMNALQNNMGQTEFENHLKDMDNKKTS